MAKAALRRPENVAGPFFVDASCIDCDTCRWMAPEVFARRHGQSAVVQQPTTDPQRQAALQALVACPTASIGTNEGDVAAAVADFPLPVTDGVLHLGHHSKDSFGATPYLILHPAGNVMVDCPRWNEGLAKRVDALGGIQLIVLTHRDDIADHERWARRFGAKRVLHRDDAPIPGGPVEWWLEGSDPTEMLPGLTAIPVPGHTAGHIALHWRRPDGSAVLFTGDHLAYDDEAGHLEAWPDVCWYDWGAQTASMRRLLDWDFEWVLPGHGRRGHLPVAAMKAELERLCTWMAGQ